MAKLLSLLSFLFGILSPLVTQAECAADRVRLQVLGSGGPEMDDQRASSGYLIWIDDQARVLIDAGPGSSINFERAGARIEDLRAIVFTHLHVDHSGAFPALIKASFFTPRSDDLPVFGPAANELMPSTTRFVETLVGDSGAFRYLSDYLDQDSAARYHIRARDVDPGRDGMERITVDDSLQLSAVAVHHGPVAALAWRVDALDCSITFSGDMSNRYQSLAGLASGSDILVAHNVIPEGAGGAARNLHMPPSEIGKIARQAGIGQLVLSHRMQRTLGKEQETRSQIHKHWCGPLDFADDLSEYRIGQ